jgi:hypothetical protein
VEEKGVSYPAPNWASSAAIPLALEGISPKARTLIEASAVPELGSCTLRVVVSRYMADGLSSREVEELGGADVLNGFVPAIFASNGGFIKIAEGITDPLRARQWGNTSQSVSALSDVLAHEVLHWYDLTIGKLFTGEAFSSNEKLTRPMEEEVIVALRSLSSSELSREIDLMGTTVRQRLLGANWFKEKSSWKDADLTRTERNRELWVGLALLVRNRGLNLELLRPYFTRTLEHIAKQLDM